MSEMIKTKLQALGLEDDLLKAVDTMTKVARKLDDLKMGEESRQLDAIAFDLECFVRLSPRVRFDTIIKEEDND